MKKNISLFAFAVMLLSFVLSCEVDNQELKDDFSIEKNEKINLKQDLTNSRLVLCEIDGPTTGCPNQYVTYTYSTTLTMQSITWSVVNGNMTLYSGQGTNTATFLLASNFTGGWVQAYGSGTPDCVVSAEILNCGAGGGGGCPCPSPVIDDILCVSGGHPHWRFEVNGITSGDQISWSVNHGTIHSNPTQSYVIIEPNSGSINGFTVYCQIVRTCPDGSTKTRTAYYTNYYGNSCGSGTTGFVDNCDNGGLD